MSDTLEHSLTTGITVPAHRTLGTSPAEYVELLHREVDAVLKQARGNRLKAVALTLARMRKAGLMTEADHKRLEQVSSLVLTAERSPRASAQAFTKVQQLHQEALADSRSSSMGTTMLGVSYRTANKQTISGAGLFGMLIGGMLTGTPWGALVGGLVGGWFGTACGDD